MVPSDPEHKNVVNSAMQFSAVIKLTCTLGKKFLKARCTCNNGGTNVDDFIADDTWTGCTDGRHAGDDIQIEGSKLNTHTYTTTYNSAH